MENHSLFTLSCPGFEIAQIVLGEVVVLQIDPANGPDKLFVDLRTARCL